MKKITLGITYLEYNTRFYSFWKPLLFKIEKITHIKDPNILAYIKNKPEHYTWLAHNFEIGLFSFSETFDDILKEICKDFDYIYREIVENNSATLDPKANLIKIKILNLLA